MNVSAMTMLLIALFIPSIVLYNHGECPKIIPNIRCHPFCWGSPEAEQRRIVCRLYRNDPGQQVAVEIVENGH